MPRRKKSIKRTKSIKRIKSTKRTSKVNKKSDLLMVFDLDETVMQFLHAKNTPDAMEIWHQMDDKDKSKLHYTISDKKHVVILRPYLKELFDFCKKSKNIRVGLWTLSERDYGNSIASLLSKEFDLPKNFFLFVYGEEDVEDYKTRKDLSMIWRDFPTYNQHNTFLVDDLKKNIMHPINRKNGFLTPPFAPFGMKGERKEILSNISESIQNAMKDKTMKEVVKIAKKIITYNNKNPTDLRPLFDKKRMADMGMTSYLHFVAKEEHPEVVRVASYGRPIISL